VDTEVSMPDFNPAAYKTGDPYLGAWQATAECGWKGSRTQDYGAAGTELAEHCIGDHRAAWELALEVMEYAKAHYNDGGWDVVAECWIKPELCELIVREGCESVQDVKAGVLGACVDVWADRQADAVNSAF
jgi:hypothetical protein